MKLRVLLVAVDVLFQYSAEPDAPFLTTVFALPDLRPAFV